MEPPSCSSDFRKHQFANYMPKAIVQQAILNDMLFKEVNKDGIHYVASLGVPDDMSSFQVQVIVGFDGRLKMQV